MVTPAIHLCASHHNEHTLDGTASVTQGVTLHTQTYM